MPGGPDTPVGRNRRLLWWLWGSLPFIVIAFVLGVALVGLHLWSWSALRSFERNDLNAAEASYQRQVSVTGVGPSSWVALYNLGSIQLKNGQHASGLESLEQAFGTVPKAIPAEDGSIQTFTYECRVRLNLAVGWETIADQQRKDGDRETAMETYDRALEWSTPCHGASDSSQLEQEGEGGSDPQQGSGGDQTDEGASTSERIDQKRQQTQREMDGEAEEDAEDSQQGSDQSDADQEDSDQDDSQESENPFDGETDQERERRESLEEKNRQQQESQRQREESSTRDPGSAGW